MAEKLSALRAESYFAERAARTDIPRALDILKRAGVGNSPAKGDALPRSKPLVRSREPAVADDIGDQDRRNFPGLGHPSGTPALRMPSLARPRSFT